MATLERLYTDRALRLIRVGNGQAASVKKSLQSLARDLTRIIRGEDLTTLTRRGLSELLKEVESVIDARYAGIIANQTAEAAELVAIEAEWARRVGKLPAHASKAAIVKAQGGVLAFGIPINQALGRQAADLALRTSGVIREAMTAESLADNILANVLGVMKRTESSAEAMAHTIVSQAASDGRRTTWKANGIKVVRWHSILDERTTAGCALRHGLLYDADTYEPIGHDIPIERPPPRHYRCRSILIGVRYGDDIPMPEDGGMSTFRKYFDSLSQEEQDSLFGVGRADLFRRGVITQSDLVGQAGQVLTLEELRERFG